MALKYKVSLQVFLLLCLLLLTSLAGAAQAGDANTDARASALMRDIRCVVCNAQSIADSDAPLAADLRREVAARIAAGEGDSAIKASLRARYGDQILLEPPLRPDTAPLWAAPVLLLLLALAVSWRLFKRKRMP